MDEFEFLNNESAERFEDMLSRNEKWYYDAEDIADVITFYIDVNDVKYAEKALLYALELHPENLEILAKKAELLVAKRKYTEAESLIQQLLLLTPENADLYIAQARIYSNKKNHGNAIEWYLKALEKSDEVEYILSNIGNEHLALDETEYALDCFNRILSYNLDDEYAFFSVIHCYDLTKNRQGCIAFLEKFIDQRPYADYAWFNLGYEYQKEKKFLKAIESYDYALIINEKLLSAYWKKAQCLERLKRFDEAILTYKETISLDNTPATTYFKMGKCYIKIKEYSKALTQFYNTIFEDPQMDKAWAELAYTYEKLDSPLEMVYYMKRALDLSPENSTYLRKYIAFLVNNHDLEEALFYYDKLIALEPQNKNNVLGKVEICFFTKSYHEAIETITSSIDNQGIDVEFLYYLCIALYHTRRYKLAREIFDKATDLNADLLNQFMGRYQTVFNSKVFK